MTTFRIHVQVVPRVVSAHVSQAYGVEHVVHLIFGVWQMHTT